MQSIFHLKICCTWLQCPPQTELHSLLRTIRAQADAKRGAERIRLSVDCLAQIAHQLFGRRRFLDEPAGRKARHLAESFADKLPFTVTAFSPAEPHGDCFSPVQYVAWFMCICAPEPVAN